MDYAVLTGVRSTHTQDMPAQRSPDLSRSKRRCNGTASCTASTIVHRVLGSPGRGRASLVKLVLAHHMTIQLCLCHPVLVELPSCTAGTVLQYLLHIGATDLATDATTDRYTVYTPALIDHRIRFSKARRGLSEARQRVMSR